MTRVHPAPKSLAEQVPFTTVRILADNPGDPSGKSGTGFFWTNKLESGGEFTVVVTNRHVVEGFKRLHMTLHERAGDSSLIGPGKNVVLEGSLLRTMFHPDPQIDLAVVAMGPILNSLAWRPFFRSVDWTMIPSAEEIEELSSLQSVVVVGYPNGVVDFANNLPIARQGVTAVAPWIDYQGKPQIVCDLAVFGGSSGSPVFVIWDGIRTSRGGGMVVGQSRMILLGVLYAGHKLDARGEIVEQEPAEAAASHVITGQMIHLALCVKSAKVLELVQLVQAQAGHIPLLGPIAPHS